MDSKKSNKIRDIVRLRQILKKWKKLANANASSNNATTTTNNGNANSNSNIGGNKSIKFLKKTLSFTETTLSYSNTSTSNDAVVPKGYLAVCVGRELKRFVIPMEYLAHQAFGILLREAEEEFGFQQEGVLKIPCEVSMFEKILKMMEQRRGGFFLHEMGYDNTAFDQMGSCYSSSPDNHNCELISPSHHAQMCR